MNLIASLNQNERSAFIVTKPLQFMIAASIIDQEKLSLRSDILVVDSFADAGHFVSRYHGLGPRWGSMGLFKNTNEAYAYARKKKYSRLFIDSDFGAQKFYTLLRNKIASPARRIAVYEEGTGTYRTDRYSGIKRTLFHRLGIGAAFGGSLFTDRIYVYETKKYRDRVGSYGCAPVGIETKLVDFIRANIADLTTLFDVPRTIGGDKGQPCCLYLTDWKINREVIAEIGRKNGLFFVKPHPHLADIAADDPRLGRASVLPAGVPAEMLIMKLKSRHSDLTVYHHGSSAAHYLANSGVLFQVVEH